MKLKTSTYNQLQTLCWTEDNRLQAVKDNKMGAYYNYDALGERNLKLTGGTMQITQNGVPVYLPVLDQQTLYASALVTVNDKGYTKHYFEEGKRICSKIGSGELQNVDNLVDHMEMNYEEQRDRQQDGITKTYEQCINITPHIKNVNLHEYVIGHYRNPMNPSEPSFYYHSDHLGSASFLTDETGIETQHLVYLPFGEDWVDMKYNTSQYDTPYKFNGKEKDQETGYNNYGARYYYDWASIWLSVDPMSDKYPHLSSYAYCANNPVMLIDPDGREYDVTGEGANNAVDQLKNKAPNLNLSLEGGKLKADGVPKTNEEKELYKAIKNTEVKVTIIANSSYEWEYNGEKGNSIDPETGEGSPGVYLGNDPVIDAGGSVIGAKAGQYVNPDELAKWDKNVGDNTSGGYMLHEFLEAFKGGQLAKDKGTSDKPISNSTEKTPRYKSSHRYANKFSKGGYEYNTTPSRDIYYPGAFIPMGKTKERTTYKRTK